MIWGYQKDSEYYDEDTIKEWLRFSNANMMKEYKIRLSLVRYSNLMQINNTCIIKLVTFVVCRVNLMQPL